jgi:hypothetical protein
VVALLVRHSDRISRGAGDKPDAAKALVDIWHEQRRANVHLRPAQVDYNRARLGIQLEVSRRGYRTAPKRTGARPRPIDTVRIARILSAAVYAGLQTHDGERSPLADWPRFIEPEDFLRLAAEREARAHATARKPGRPTDGYLLQGLGRHAAALARGDGAAAEAIERAGALQRSEIAHATSRADGALDALNAADAPQGDEADLPVARLFEALSGRLDAARAISKR